jgi:hypothetical protein
MGYPVILAWFFAVRAARIAVCYRTKEVVVVYWVFLI